MRDLVTQGLVRGRGGGGGEGKGIIGQRGEDSSEKPEPLSLESAS